jgi:hypothetical protein
MEEFEMERVKDQLFRVCPETGRIAGIRPYKQQAVWLYPFIGLAALIWFLIRVVPKPSRASYPCQRVAMPMAVSFLSWLLGTSASTVVLRKLNLSLAMRRFINTALCIFVGIGLLGGGSASALNITVQAYTNHPVNSPIGTTKGLMPGSVVWVHDPLVTDWNGTASNASQSWFNHISQSASTNLMQWALMGYAGSTSTPAAWDAIFHYFNGGSAGYQSGEKIFIKINLTTSQADSCADSSYNWIPSACGTSWSSIGPSPQLMVALLDQLVNTVGVAQTDITIGDSTGLWVNELFNIVHGSFPNVKYLDARGTLGRTKATKSTTRLYWSTSEDDGKSPDYLLQAVVDAKYMINFSVLKSHERNGITVAAKNHFGSLSGGNDNVRKPITTGYYNLHLRLPLETAADAWPQRASMAQYRPLVDLNGHTGMGGKTLLYLVDGTFGGRGWSGIPSKWAMSPFNNNWPCSLFVSMDEVAIDSVAFDFLSQQFPTEALGNEGVQDYLHEMALADNPPSGTFYDPENDGIRMTSQGVHEHWNNAADKQYSRNLGTGNGIELLYFPSDPSTIEYTLADSNDGHGSVTLNPAGGTYVSGITVTLTPVPSEGYQFSAWTGPNAANIIDNSSVYTIIMNRNKAVQANFTLAPSQSIPLVTGWNLVSFRLHPTSTAITDVLSSLGSNYDLVYVWDATGGHAGAGNWMRYAPGIPGNTLSTLDETQGFWIRMTGEDMLEIAGTAPTTTNINLVTTASGWNLVGYPSDENRSMPGALTSHGVSDYSLVYAYHADETDTWKRYAPGVPGNDLLELTPGWGYWIKVSAPNTWIFP